jgi:hypothetical protein
MPIQFDGGKMVFNAGKVAMNVKCCRCDAEEIRCTKCIASPQQFQLVFSGIADGTCVDCDGTYPDDGFNDTFIVDWEAGCLWTYRDAGNPCQPGGLIMGFGVGDSVISATIYVGSSYLEWRATRPSGDCDTWVNEVLTFYEADGSFCDASTAICTVTAL